MSASRSTSASLPRMGSLQVVVRTIVVGSLASLTLMSACTYRAATDGRAISSRAREKARAKAAADLAAQSGAAAAPPVVDAPSDKPESKPSVPTGTAAARTEEQPTVPAQPPTLRIDPNTVEEGRIEDARAAAENEDYETALRIFRELLQDNPTLADAYTGIGTVYEKKGELELAEPAYARAVALDPNDFTANAGHARVLEALGRSKEAIRALQRALTIRPKDFESNLAMSRLLLASDQTDGAVAFAERAIRLDAQSGLAHLALARAYSKAGRGADAIREYETACELIEPPVEVMFALINAYAEAKRYREAANAAETLTKTAPSAPAFERLGWALFRLNEFDKSDEVYRKAIAIDPGYWPALNGVGVNALNKWIKAGKGPDDPLRDEARSMLQRSLKSNPDQPKVAALLLKYRL